MTVTKDDFEKIWASSSPLTPYSFSDSQYKEGWNFVGATPPSRQMWDAFMQNADEKLKYLYQHEDIPLGHEYFTFNPNVPQGSLPLFGGEYDRATYSDLWNWVQQQTGYLKTEAEWQTLSASNNGNVPYYSDGDGSTTFRVPSLKCWVKGANGTVSEVGSYLAAGLPDITGVFGFHMTAGSPAVPVEATGAFEKTGVWGAYSTATITNAQENLGRINFDASRSNSIYGNSTTVQPESIVGLWLVKAYGVIVDTGTINEQQYIDDRISALPLTFLEKSGGMMSGAIKGNPLTLTADDGNGNTANLVLNPNGSATWNSKEVERVNASGTNYIRCESGLQIVWGSVGASTAGTTVTFPVAFANTTYAVIPQSSGTSLTAGYSSKTTTSVVIESSHQTVQATVDYICIGRWK